MSRRCRDCFHYVEAGVRLDKCDGCIMENLARRLVVWYPQYFPAGLAIPPVPFVKKALRPEWDRAAGCAFWVRKSAPMDTNSTQSAPK